MIGNVGNCCELLPRDKLPRWTLPPASSLFLSPSGRLLGEIPIPWAALSQQSDSQRKGQLLRISPCLAGTVTSSSSTNACLQRPIRCTAKADLKPGHKDGPILCHLVAEVLIQLCTLATYLTSLTFGCLTCRDLLPGTLPKMKE